MLEYPNEENEDDLEAAELVEKFKNAVDLDELKFFDEDEINIICDTLIDEQDIILSEKAIEYGLNIHPNSIEIKAQLSKIYLLKGEYKKSIAYIDKIGLQNLDVHYYAIKAKAHMKMNHFEKSNELLKQYLLNCDPDTLRISFQEITNLYNHYNQPKHALDFLYYALTLFPNDILLLTEKAIALYNDKKYYESIAISKELIKTDNYNQYILHSIAYSCFFTNQFLLSLDYIDYKIRFDKERLPDDLFIKANCLFHLEREEEALNIYIEIEDYFFENASYIAYRADAHRILKEYKNMELFLHVALTYNSNNNIDEIWYKMAECYDLQNDQRAAVKLLEHYLTNKPSTTTEHRLSRYELAIGNQDCKFKKSGLKHLLNCLKASPDNAIYNFDAGNYYFIEKKYKTALRYYLKAYKSSYYTDDKLYIFIAMTYYGLSKYDEMQKFYHIAERKLHNAKEIFISLFPEAEELL